MRGLPLWPCQWVLLPILVVSLFSCGSPSDVEKRKDYRLALVSDQPDLKTEFRRLIQDFNELAGVNALTYVDNPAAANSAIVVTKGLHDRDGKVGWGQWLSESEQEAELFGGGKRTVTYSMRLEFDEDYLRRRIASDETEKMRYDKQKLFFHEVGHGMLLDHDDNPRSLMYYDISGEKDFTVFFDYVRSFMEDRG